MSKFSNAPAAAPHVACRTHGGREITVKIVLERDRDQPFIHGAKVVLTGPVPIPPLASNKYSPPPALPETSSAPVTTNAKGIARFRELAAGRYAASASRHGWSFIPDGTLPTETSELTLLAVEQNVRWGIDTNLVLTDAAIAYAKQQKSGLMFVGRYLSLDPQQHPMLSLPEAQRYAAHGLDVVALFERSNKQAINAGSPEAERTAADQDLDAAVGCLNASGGTDAVMYFTCDFPVSPSTWNGYRARISAYFHQLAHRIHPSRLGVYGSYTVLDHLFHAGYVQWGWQTIFGSPPGPIHPKANLCQYDIYPDTRGYSFTDANGNPTPAGAGALDLDVVVTPAGFGGFRPH